MKVNVWVLSTCNPGEDEPCQPNVCASEEEAESLADKMLRAEWEAANVEDEYPGDWREAQCRLVDWHAAGNGEDEQFGQWEITGPHTIDAVPIGHSPETMDALKDAAPTPPTDDAATKLAEQWGGYWHGEHPDHPHEDWVTAVYNDDTRLGYWQWVIQASVDEEDAEPIATPEPSVERNELRAQGLSDPAGVADLAIDQLLIAYAKGRTYDGHIEWEDVDIALEYAKAARPGRYEEIVELLENMETVTLSKAIRDLPGGETPRIEDDVQGPAYLIVADTDE